jgi:hypothetical protein
LHGIVAVAVETDRDHLVLGPPDGLADFAGGDDVAEDFETCLIQAAVVGVLDVELIEFEHRNLVAALA